MNKIVEYTQEQKEREIVDIVAVGLTTEEPYENFQVRSTVNPYEVKETINVISGSDYILDSMVNNINAVYSTTFEKKKEFAVGISGGYTIAFTLQRQGPDYGKYKIEEEINGNVTIIVGPVNNVDSFVNGSVSHDIDMKRGARYSIWIGKETNNNTSGLVRMRDVKLTYSLEKKITGLTFTTLLDI